VRLATAQKRTSHLTKAGNVLRRTKFASLVKLMNEVGILLLKLLKHDRVGRRFGLPSVLHVIEFSLIYLWPVQSTYETSRTNTSHGIGEVSRLSVQVKSGGAGLHSWEIAPARRPERSNRF
jgi:hypothetical protein